LGYPSERGTIQHLNDISFTDEYNGWIVGADGIILHTTDGGTTWLPQTSEITGELKGVCFIDANTGWAVGILDPTNNNPGIILHTENAGETWEQQLVLDYQFLSGVTFVDANNGWVVGGQDDWLDFGYTILQTTDGGTNWTTQLYGGLYWLMGVSFTNANNGTVVGGSFSGVIFRTTNGGTTWTEQILGNYSFLGDVSFADVNNGTAVGHDWSNNNIGLILRTTNGGTDWTPQTSGTTNSLNGVFFIDALNGWAVGGNGTILRTTNGGVPVELTSFIAITTGKEVILSWSTATELNNQLFEVQRSFEVSEFATIGFVNGKGTTTERQDYSYSDEVFTDGKYYYRLKQIDYLGSYEYSDVVEIDFRTFNSYLLEQCYPNPFNPSTKIKYNIPSVETRHASSLQMVSLKIYDILGNELETLVNEEKPGGTYEVTWYAESLPSGVYFYQLKATPNVGQAGSLVETKKMLLLK
jgi:photosystem II stability/assembly factor-like uncharacterized protein